jgi:hypothetical protein
VAVIQHPSSPLLWLTGLQICADASLIGAASKHSANQTRSFLIEEPARFVFRRWRQL